jgi:hypothetical protein
MPALNEPIQKMLVNTRLSNRVSSCVGCSMSHSWHMKTTLCSPSVRASNVDRRRRIHRVAIRGVARSEGADRLPIWREAALTRVPEPTRAAPAERFQRAISVKHFDRSAGPRVDVVERVMSGALHGGSLHSCQRCASSNALDGLWVRSRRRK